MADAAIVIGATGGLGAALIERLREQGSHAVIHALSRANGLDLEDEPSIIAAANQIAGGPPPTLIVVATGVLHDGFDPERGYRALSADHLLRDYRINAVGPALVAKHLLPLMPRDRRAVFAALSARVGSIGDNRLGGWHSYRASKAALNMILKSLAIELSRTHPHAIIAGLHPGTVATELSAPFQKNVRADRLFTPARAAEQLLAVIDDLSPADSGGVIAWDGTRVPA